MKTSYYFCMAISSNRWNAKKIVSLAIAMFFCLKIAAQNIFLGPSEIRCPGLTPTKLKIQVVHPLIGLSLDEYDRFGNFVGSVRLTADPNNHTPLLEGYQSTELGMGYNEVTIYPRKTVGTIKVGIWIVNPLLPGLPPRPTIRQSTHTLPKILPTPQPPNSGRIVGCFPGEVVPVSSLPVIPNDSTNCNFHCDYAWYAPSGFTYNRSGYSPSNPQDWAVSINFPTSGLTNGHMGQATVWAAHARGCYADDSTYSQALIFYGKPIIENPTISYEYPTSQLLSIWNSTYMYPLEWNMLAGNAGAYIVPIGSIGECWTYSMNWGIVEVKAANRCGSTTYTFYINWMSMYTVHPNPAKDVVTIEFKNEEVAKHAKNLKLYDKNGRVIWEQSENSKAKLQTSGKEVEIDVSDLPTDTYFLHMETKDGIKKSQILVE